MWHRICFDSTIELWRWELGRGERGKRTCGTVASYPQHQAIPSTSGSTKFSTTPGSTRFAKTTAPVSITTSSAVPPCLPPGQYFRVMMIGFFEGLDSERGIAWRLADSLTLRQFLSIGLDEKTPD